MKEKIKITRVFRGKQAFTDKKTGVAKEADKIGIKTDKYGDKWISSFKVQGTENWKEGDEVEIFIEKKGDYLNFTLSPSIGATTAALEARVAKLEDFVFGKKENSVAQTTVAPDEDDF